MALAYNKFASSYKDNHTSMAKLGFHGYVSGKVQGVWFRASTKTQAESLGLTGWVRNLSDGRVELMACGDEADVRALQAWLWEGPAIADVTDVTGDFCDCEDHDAFVVL